MSEWKMILVDSEEKCYELIQRIIISRRCAIDTETTGLFWALGDKAFVATFAPDLEASYIVQDPIAASRILVSMETNDCEFIFHNAVFDLHMLRVWCDWYPPKGYCNTKLQDTMHGFRILYPGESAALKVASKRYAPDVDVDGPQQKVKAWLAAHTTRERVAGKLVTVEPKWNEIPEDLLLPYATQDAWLTLKDWQGLEHDIKSHVQSGRLKRGKRKIPELWEAYRSEIDVISVTTEMERVGFPVDRDALAAGLERGQQEVERLQEQWQQLGYGDINPQSAVQLRQLIYSTLGEEVIHRTKAGEPSTGEFALRDMTHRNVADLLIELRGWKKYLERLTEIDSFLASDNRVHSSFLAEGARTGRFTSRNPAMQNISRPNPERPYTMVRDVFRPEPGKEFLFMDFSQIELRLAAEYLGDDIMKQAFVDGTDFHALTASRMYGVPLEEVIKAQRALAKILNFAILYGAGHNRINTALRYGAAASDPLTRDEAYHALEQLWGKTVKFVSDSENPPGTVVLRAEGVPLTEDDQLFSALARALLDAYHRENPLVKQFIKNAGCVAKAFGCIVTAFGFYVPIPSERPHIAGNAIIQGSAAGLMKATLVRTERVLRRYCFENRFKMWEDVELITTIHDELAAQVPIGHALPIARALQPVVTDWPQFSVPIEVEFAIVRNGSSWAYKEDLSLEEVAA